MADSGTYGFILTVAIFNILALGFIGLYGGMFNEATALSLQAIHSVTSGEFSGNFSDNTKIETSFGGAGLNFDLIQGFIQMGAIVSSIFIFIDALLIFIVVRVIISTGS
jgi:hypothetical protein